MFPPMDPVAIWNSAALLLPGAATDHLTVGQKALHTAFWVDALTHNGGFLDSFGSAGKLVNDAPAAYELLGLNEAADLVRQGLALFPEGRLPDDLDEASRLVDSLPDAVLLDEIGGRYWDAVPDLYQTFVSYLEAHPDEFPAPLRPAT